MKDGYPVTIDAPQQVPTEESRETSPALDLIVLGALGVVCAIALVVLSTIGQQAAVGLTPTLR